MSRSVLCRFRSLTAKTARRSPSLHSGGHENIIFCFSSAFNVSPKAGLTGMRTWYPFSTTLHSPVLAKSSRNLKYGKRVAYISSSMGILYVFDRYYNASAIFRSLRTIWTVCASILSVPLPYWWHRSVVCDNNVRLQNKFYAGEQREYSRVAWTCCAEDLWSLYLQRRFVH